MAISMDVEAVWRSKYSRFRWVYIIKYLL